MRLHNFMLLAVHIVRFGYLLVTFKSSFILPKSHENQYRNITEYYWKLFVKYSVMNYIPPKRTRLGTCLFWDNYQLLYLEIDLNQISKTQPPCFFTPQQKHCQEQPLLVHTCVLTVFT